MNDNLPPLPEPWVTDTEESGTREDGESIFVDIPLFTEEQMREYGQLCRQQALEEAAQQCEDVAENGSDLDGYDTAYGLSYSIRSMK